MKIRILITFTILQKSLLFFGQNWYAGIDGGYSLGMASQNITTNIKIGLTETTNANVKGSFGRGLNMNTILGYNITNQISCELGISYLKGFSFKGSYFKDSVFSQDIVISGNMLRVMPALKITSGGESKRTRMYLKVGMVARLAGKITVENSYFDIPNNTTTISETKYTKGLSLGTIASAGFFHRISNKIKIFGELFFIAQSWGPKNSDITKYSINGVDQLKVLGFGQKSVHYTNNYKSTTTAQSTYIPSQQLRQYHNFSSIGINVGIQFAFRKKEVK